MEIIFSIAYVNGGTDQQIAAVSDSLGHVIAYNYDANNQLLTITQGGVHSYTDPSGTKTYATFTWGTTPLNYSFSPLTVSNSPPSGR